MISATPVALGFRVHSGWAAFVVLAAPASAPAIVSRGRMELVQARAWDELQPYHAAVEMTLPKAEAFIARAIERTRRLACDAVRAEIAALAARNCTAAACGMLTASGRALPGLDAILASHPLLHTAEGELFRGALAHACETASLPVWPTRERDLLARVEEVLGLDGAARVQRLAVMGRQIGPPWRQDEKYATLAAWLALSASTGKRR